MRRSLWLIPLAALLATLSLLHAGPSCGKDALFHLQSWLDAAVQLRHGTLYPRWSFFSAFNAGEPRFVFYPPLSWMLGALLTLVLPFRFVPGVLVWIALSIAGFSMYRLARLWATPTTAIIAACVYLANPFMLFTVSARSAYGELFAAAFFPLLVAAAFAETPTAIALGLPVALMWLSNVPGGVIAAYALALLILIRLARSFFADDLSLNQAKSLLLPTAGAFAFALSLDAFYLLPAIRQKPFIQVSGAFPPGFRTTDNLFLHRLLEHARDGFFIQLAHIAAGLALAFAACILATWWRTKAHPQRNAAWQRFGIPTLLLAATVSFLMTFLSKPLWPHLPMMGVLQFPWRLLFVLATCLAAAIALLLREHPRKPSQAIAASLALTLAFATFAHTAYHCPCGDLDTPDAVRLRQLNHESSAPTDEYATGDADNTLLRTDNPPHWLAATPGDYAPGTTPTTDDMISDDRTPKLTKEKHLSATELSFTVDTTEPTYLAVNLQDYPNWRVTRNGDILQHLSRPDGLLVVPIPAGTSSIAIQWHHSWDERLGAAITALTVLFWVFYTYRRKPTKP